MKILITGIGDAYTARHFGSSALIEAPEGYVLLDCPDPIHRVLREATTATGWDIDYRSINDIILTHLHGDHSNGLEMFGFRRLYMDDSNPAIKPRLHATQPVIDRLWEKLAPSMDGAHYGTLRTLDDFFDVRLIDPEHETTIAGMSVRCRFTGHPISTIGLMINDGKNTLGWSSDTPYEQAHIDWLRDADVIVHESNLGLAHTPIEDLNALPDELRAKMRLIHLPDDFDPQTTDMIPLHQGELLTF